MSFNIEYRIYYGIDKKYLYSSFSNSFLTFKIDEYQNIDNRLNPEYFIIEQFTGVLDKNNRKIFVGDIIKCMGKKNAVIGFHKGSFGFFIDATFYELSYWNSNQIEIIGNEKLNPELL